MKQVFDSGGIDRIALLIRFSLSLSLSLSQSATVEPSQSNSRIKLYFANWLIHFGVFRNEKNNPENDEQ